MIRESKMYILKMCRTTFPNNSFALHSVSFLVAVWLLSGLFGCATRQEIIEDNKASFLYVPPKEGCPVCETPVTDGVVNPSEYYGGAKVPMQDYGRGGENGEMYLAVANTTLYLGIRVPVSRGSLSIMGGRGSLIIYLDANRLDTLDLQVGATGPRAEDRRLSFNYTIPESAGRVDILGVNQSMGNAGAWVSQQGGTLWTTAQLSSVPGESDPGFIHFEIAIDMKPMSETVSEPISSGLLGLGVYHRGSDGSYQVLPNDKDWPLSDINLTRRWQTIYFHMPEATQLSMATYNIGQTADWMIAGDGGSGDIWSGQSETKTDFTDYIWDKDVVCINEVWSEADREELVADVQNRREANGMNPMHVAGIDWGGDVDVGYTGLLLFSSRPFAEPPQYHEYDEDLCEAFDCCGRKGAIWGRILFEGGEPPDEPPITNANIAAGRPQVLVGNADHFVDIYCTHLENTDSSEEKAGYEIQCPFNPACSPCFSETAYDPSGIRAKQIAELRDFIDTTRAPDRPAFVMGDFNIRGGDHDDPPTQEYYNMMDILLKGFPKGLDSYTSWLNSVYDLGMVNQPPIGTNISGGDCTPSIGTEIKSNARYDFIIQIPPPQEWPDWGVAADPVVTVDPHYVTSIDPEECLSDHAMLMAEVGLIQTTQPNRWNVKKDHRVSFEINALVDRDDSGCCADWYTSKFYIGGASNSYSDDATPDGAEVGSPINPGWKVSTTLSALEQADMEVEVWEWDAGDDDHYDVSEYGRDPEFRFYHANGRWVRPYSECLVWDDTSPIFPECLSWLYGELHLGSIDDFPEGMTYYTYGSGSEKYGDAGEVLKATELP
jgi:hypothetical protein